jgi:hypothetical protein
MATQFCLWHAWPNRQTPHVPLTSRRWISFVGLREGRIYTTKVRDLWDLQTQIVEAVGTTTPDMLQRTWAELNYRLEILCVASSAHIEVYWFFKSNFVLCDWYLSIIMPYLYSLLPENPIKSGHFIVDTLYTVHNLNYAPTTLVVQSWGEIISGGMRTKKAEYHCLITCTWSCLVASL